MAAGAIVVALMVSVGWLWWAGRDTSPQVGDGGRVTARVDDECIGLRFEFEGVLLNDTWRMDEAQTPPPAAWRGAEVRGTVAITGRDGPDVRGTFTADGVEVPVAGSTGTSFTDAACRGWPAEEPPGP